MHSTRRQRALRVCAGGHGAGQGVGGESGGFQNVCGGTSVTTRWRPGGLGVPWGPGDAEWLSGSGLGPTGLEGPRVLTVSLDWVLLASGGAVSRGVFLSLPILWRLDCNCYLHDVGAQEHTVTSWLALPLGGIELSLLLHSHVLPCPPPTRTHTHVLTVS